MGLTVVDGFWTTGRRTWRKFACMTRSLLLASFVLAACSAAGDPIKTLPDNTNGTVGGTDPGNPNPGTQTGPGTGAPQPNVQTDGDNERCLLLYGGSDRLKANDVGLPFGTSARTVQAWVRTNWSGEQVAVAYGRGSVLQGFTLGVDGGTAFVDTNGTARVSGEIRIDDDEWHHLAAMWDGNIAVLVVDGQTDVVETLEGNTESGGFNVGNYTEAAPLFAPWIGWIDDVRVFSFARQPADVAEDLDGIDDEGALVGWFDFEVEGDVEGPGIIVEDLSPNNNDGETAGSEDHPQFPFCR